MRLSSQEMQLFEAACSDRGNDAAQELLNLFAAQSAEDVILLLPSIPLALLKDLATQLWRAINYEHRRRTGKDLVVLDQV